MKHKIIRHAELTATRWSGGATTQLAIWPEEASYAARDFVWRVSSATVEDEESEFTPLAGYTRVLMVLEGGLSLLHDTPERRQVTLGRFGQTSFPGGAPTRSLGRATDFNLMLRDGSDGYVASVCIPVGEGAVAAARPMSRTHRSEVLYLYAGEVAATLSDGRTLPMDKGDVLIVSCGGGEPDADLYLANTSSDCEAIVIRAAVFH